MRLMKVAGIIVAILTAAAIGAVWGVIETLRDMDDDKIAGHFG